MTAANDPRFDELVAKFKKEGYSLRIARENAARIIHEDQINPSIPVERSDSVRIKQLFFFPNGNVAAFDKLGRQVPEWQVPTWAQIVRKMMRRKLIDAETEICLPFGESYTLKQIIEKGWLKP